MRKITYKISVVSSKTMEISRFLHFIYILFTIVKENVKKVNFLIRFYVNLTIFIVLAF